MIVGFDFSPPLPNVQLSLEQQRRFDTMHEDYRAARTVYAETLERAKANKKVKKTKKVKDHPVLEHHKELIKNAGKILNKLAKGGKVQKMLSLSVLRFPVPTKGVITVQEIAEDFALKVCDQLFGLRGRFKQSPLLSVMIWISIQVLRRITEGCNILAKEKKPDEEMQALISLLTVVRKKLIEHVQLVFSCIEESYRSFLALPEEEDVFLVSEQIKGFYELVIHDFTNGIYTVTEAIRLWNDAYRVQLLVSNTNILLPEVWDRYGKSIYSFRTKSMEDVVDAYLVLLEGLKRHPEPKELPFHMLVTYMTGPGDLSQVYSLINACKSAPRQKLSQVSKKKILETCRNVAIDIIKASYSKTVKDANSGNGLTKGLADRLVRMGKEYFKLAIETSESDVRVASGEIKHMLLKHLLDEFNSKNRFWPQCIGCVLQGYFPSDNNTKFG